MDAMQCLMTRRSIRKFSEKKVEDNDIAELLSAAMHAPSAKNRQPWHFVVINDKEVLGEIESKHPYASMLKTAKAAIAVCADEKLVKSVGYWPMDCANATMNILIGAHAKGLGAVWVSVHPVEERIQILRDALHLPANIHPVSLIPLGYPDQEPREKDIAGADRIHYDRW